MSAAAPVRWQHPSQETESGERFGQRDTTTSAEINSRVKKWNLPQVPGGESWRGVAALTGRAARYIERYIPSCQRVPLGYRMVEALRGWRRPGPAWLAWLVSWVRAGSPLRHTHSPNASDAASSGPEAASWEWTDAFGWCCVRDRRSLINNNE